MAENFSIDLNNKSFLIQEEKKPVIQKSADEEKYFSQLRDCFNAGYQFPQFCIDNNIKKPLFVGVDESQKTFLWEICLQFQYDKRLQAQFAVLEGVIDPVKYVRCSAWVKFLQAKNISEVNLENFDKIILLSTENNFKNKNVICIDALTDSFIVRVYWDIPLLHFMQGHPGITLVLINTPALRSSSDNTEHEKYLLKNRLNVAVHTASQVRRAVRENKIISTPYDVLGYTNQEVAHLLKFAMSRTLPDGSVTMEDDEFLHIKNGKRMTANQPKSYKNTIYFNGGCVPFGYGVPWDKTVESHLQNLLNKAGLPYRVENAASVTAGRRQDIFYELNNLKLNVGDIVFLLSIKQIKYFPFCDTSHILDRPHNYGEVFPDGYHINENGHRAWADYIFKYLKENNFFQDVEFNYPPPPIASSSLWHSERIFFTRDEFFTKSAA